MLGRSTMFFSVWIALLLSVSGCTSDLSTQTPQARIFVANQAGKVSVIEHTDGEHTLAEPIDLSSGTGEMAFSMKNHIFVNMGNANQVATIDPVGEKATFRGGIAVGQRPGHIYRDPEGSRIWVLNDADPITGIDTLTPACSAASAASVSVIQDYDHVDQMEEEEKIGKVLATICVGKGDHIAAFSVPSLDMPTVPLRAFVSNSIDGTISVIDNNPASANYLKVVGTIDLCDPSREPGGTCDADPTTLNASGPQGMFYSSVSGRLYNSNEGYGTVNIVNPGVSPAAAIEQTLEIEFAGPIHITPDGRFIFVLGTDDSDADRVVGKLTIITVADNSITQIDLPNLGLAAIECTADGSKMYIASSANGQTSNIVQVFDTLSLPTLTLIKEIAVGSTSEGRSIGLFEHSEEISHLFVTNQADGTVSVIDVKTDTVIDTIHVGESPTSLLIFPIGEHQQGGVAHH